MVRIGGLRRIKLIKIWVDDVRPAPAGFVWCKSVNQTKAVINDYVRQHSSYDTILIDLDHDAGDYFKDGGDYIKILDWLEEQQIVNANYFFKIHSQNPVGVMNMKDIIWLNGWRLVL